MEEGIMAMPGLAADQHSCWLIVNNIFGAIYPIFMAVTVSVEIETVKSKFAAIATAINKYVAIEIATSTT